MVLGGIDSAGGCSPPGERTLRTQDETKVVTGRHKGMAEYSSNRVRHPKNDSKEDCWSWICRSHRSAEIIAARARLRLREVRAYIHTYIHTSLLVVSFFTLFRRGCSSRFWAWGRTRSRERTPAADGRRRQTAPRWSSSTPTATRFVLVINILPVFIIFESGFWLALLFSWVPSLTAPESEGRNIKLLHAALGLQAG